MSVKSFTASALLLAVVAAFQVGDKVTITEVGPSQGLKGQVTSVDPTTGNPTVEFSHGPPAIVGIFLAAAVAVSMPAVAYPAPAYPATAYSTSAFAAPTPATAAVVAAAHPEPVVAVEAAVAALPQAAAATAAALSAHPEVAVVAAAGVADSADSGHGSAPASGSGSSSHGSSCHDSHAEHFHSYVPTEGGVVCGLFLVGAVAFVMAIYYAVNWWQKKPRLFAWKMISATISIFLSVITFNAVQFLIVDNLSFMPEEFWQVLCFFLFYVIGQIVCRHFIYDHLLLIALGTCCGHMFGFSAISAFVGIQHQLNEEGEGVIIGVCFGFVFVIGVVIVIGTMMRKKVEERLLETMSEHDVHLWMEQCVEAEDDSIGLAVGLFMSQIVQYIILGHLPPLTGYPAGKSQSQIHQLLMCVVGSSCLLLLSTYTTKKVMHTVNVSFLPTARLARIIQCINAMTTTWLTIFWSQWQYYSIHHQDKMIMKTVLAVMISAGVFPMLSVLSMQCVADSGIEAKALRAIIGALGLLVGISWEKAFDFAIRKVVLRGEGETGPSFELNMILWTVALDAIIGVAWAYFILPKATPELAEQGGADKLWGDMMVEEESEEHNGGAWSKSGSDSDE